VASYEKIAARNREVEGLSSFRLLWTAESHAKCRKSSPKDAIIFVLHFEWFNNCKYLQQQRASYGRK